MIAIAAVALVLLRGGLQLLLYRGGFESLTADEFARVFVAARWAESAHPIGLGPWPPLQFYVVGAALWAHWDLIVTPRVIAAIVGLTAIGLVSAIGARLGGRSTGLLAGFALAVDPSHVWLSSTPLSEGLYATLWMAGVLATMHYQSSGSALPLLLAALSFAAASATRLEGWTVAVLFAAFCAWQIGRADDARRRLWCVVALVVALAFPALWILSDHAAHGTAFSFLRDIQSYKLAYAERVGGPRAGPATWLAVAYAIDPLVLPAALVGALVLARDRRREWLPYALFGCAPLPLFLVAQAGHVDPWVNHVRYLSPFFWLLLPLAAYGAMATLDAVAPRPRRRAVLVGLALALFGAWQARQALAIRSDPSAAGLAAGRELARLRGANVSAALVEVGYFDFLAIHAGANDVDRIVYDRTLDHGRLSAMHDALGDGWPEPWNGPCGGLPASVLDDDWLARCLRAGDVGYVVARTAATRARLEHEFGLAPRREIEGYAIYEVPQALRGDVVVGSR